MNKSEAIKEYEAAAAAPRWYVVNSNLHAERLALMHLCKLPELEVYLPIRFASRGSKSPTLPFLPGYLFIRPTSASPNWNLIRTTVGVRDVLGVGLRPTPVPAALIDRMRAHEVDGVIFVKPRPKEKSPFKNGDKLRVKAGPFMDFECMFEGGDEQRVLVLLSLFGRRTRVEIEVNDLQLVLASPQSKSAC